MGSVVAGMNGTAVGKVGSQILWEGKLYGLVGMIALVAGKVDLHIGADLCSGDFVQVERRLYCWDDRMGQGLNWTGSAGDTVGGYTAGLEESVAEGEERRLHCWKYKKS